MTYFIKFLKTIWAIYAFLVFIISLIILFPIYLLVFTIFKENGYKKIFLITRWWGKILLYFYLVRLKIYREAKLEKDKSYIIVCNHRSILDILVCASLISNRFRFLSKIEVNKIPLFGRIIKGVGIIVDRNKNTECHKSYNQMVDSLKNGCSITLFPEGTRNKSSAPLKSFYNGAFKLALETGFPLVIITLWETSKIYNSDIFLQLFPGNVKCYISKPLIVTGKEFTLTTLKEYVSSVMSMNIKKTQESIQNK